MGSKVLITGGAGFIGSRLCEKLTLQYGMPYRALVRNFSKAPRIARLGADLAAGDLNNPAALEKAISGCHAVVHLGFDPGLKAEENLIAACQSARVKRFVHVSSMAVYGPHPSPDCARESTANIGLYNEAYSDAKVRAEKTIQHAIDGGFPGIILRPTIVYGPHSPFVTRIVRDARAGEVSLLDGGRGICNAVYVDDVCDAIHAALSNEDSIGKAMVINGDRAITWREFTLTFAYMVSPRPRLMDFTVDEARNHWLSEKPTLRTNVIAMKNLLRSSVFEEQLETVPALRSTIRWMKRNLKRALTPDELIALKGAVVRPKPTPLKYPDPGRIVREDFHLEFSNELARSLLNWKPSFDFASGSEMTRSWLEYSHILEPAL